MIISPSPTCKGCAVRIIETGCCDSMEENERNIIIDKKEHF